MNWKIKLYFAASPGSYKRWDDSLPISVMSYRISRSFHLYRAVVPNMHGRIMSIDCTGFTGYGPHNVLISEIIMECTRLGYSGIMMNIFGAPSQAVNIFCTRLLGVAGSRGISLYLPMRFAPISDSVKVLIPAACFDGTFRTMLKEASADYGADRLALTFDGRHTDFSIPSRNTPGKMISDGDFKKICDTHRPKPHYSRELCENYITYSRYGRTHMILWDDEKSIKDKLSIAEELSVGEAFVFNHSVSGLISEAPES